MGIVFLHVEIIYPSCERNVHMYLKREGFLCFFFCKDLGGMGFMFHANHMFHRSLALPAREVWYQQAAGASDLTMRKQQVALGFFR